MQKLNKDIIAVFLVILLSVIVYANIFRNEFLWDDTGFIVNNPDIKDFSNIPKFFAYPDFGGLYRPLKTILMTITYKVWGLKPFGYHLNSLVLHSLASVLIFFISSALFKKRVPAFLAAIIFAVHPIHTERVTGVTAGFDLLGIVFYLLSFFLYLKFKELKNKGFFYGSLIIFILALLSSEEAISLPFMILTYETIFNHNKIKEIINKNSIKQLSKKSGIYFLILIFYIVIRFRILGQLGRVSTYVAGDFYSTMLTMSKVIIKYIGLLIFPVNLSLNNTMPFSTSIFDFKIIIYLITIFLILFYAFKQFSRNKLVSFAIFWFFITLMPFYNIIPLNVLYAERYLYLPSFSICILFSKLCYKIKNISYTTKNKSPKMALTAILVLTMLILSIATIKRNNDWQNAEILWKKTIETSPDYSVGYNNLGNVYLGQGKDKEALKLFIKAIELDPSYSYPYNNLGIISKKMGNYSIAIDYYKKAVSLAGDNYEAHYNLGTLYNELGEYDKAIIEFVEAIKIKPTYAKAHNNLGISLMNMGDIEGAVKEFKRALEIDPNYEQARNNLEIIYDSTSD